MWRLPVTAQLSITSEPHDWELEGWLQALLMGVYEKFLAFSTQLWCVLMSSHSPGEKCCSFTNYNMIYSTQKFSLSPLSHSAHSNWPVNYGHLCEFNFTSHPGRQQKNAFDGLHNYASVNFHLPNPGSGSLLSPQYPSGITECLQNSSLVNSP